MLKSPLELTRGGVAGPTADSVRSVRKKLSLISRGISVLGSRRPRGDLWGGVIIRVMTAVPFPLPKPGDDGVTILRFLGNSFNLLEVVVDALIKSKIDNLDEFRFFFEDESKVEPWLGKLSLGEDKQIQAAPATCLGFSALVLPASRTG